MARIPEQSRREWIAFLAGAVAMLAFVLVWAAWSKSREAAGAMRADMMLPTAELPSLPDTPPPEGPRMPQLPLPGPR